MALFTPGPAVAEVRGSVGGTVYSRNRYGAYMRFRAKPTVSTSDEAVTAKARMTAATQAWQDLTVARRLAWNAWAQANPVVGSLGFPQTLTGHAAWVGNHCRRAFIGGTPPTDPPVTPAPAPLSVMTFVPDKTTGDCEITFATTPLPAATHIWIRAAQVASAGISYVDNLLRRCGPSAAAQASPFDALAAIEGRIGALTIGFELFLYVSAFDYGTGLLSVPRRAHATIF